jgi:muramoyltetrapeptide carboxypeptidase
MPPLDGAILALEDIDEQPYQLDRSLEQLAQGGCLDGISGLVLGTFPISDPLGRGPALEEVLGSWAQRLGVPCLAGLPFGHVADPLALPVGGSAELNIGGTSWSFRASL